MKPQHTLASLVLLTYDGFQKHSPIQRTAGSVTNFAEPGLPGSPGMLVTGDAYGPSVEKSTDVPVTLLCYYYLPIRPSLTRWATGNCAF